jgi:hypothetical protein
MLEFVKQNAFTLSAGAFGLYSAAKGARNVQSGQGCRKCETTQALLGLGLAAWAGVVVWQATKR